MSLSLDGNVVNGFAKGGTAFVDTTNALNGIIGRKVKTHGPCIYKLIPNFDDKNVPISGSVWGPCYQLDNIETKIIGVIYFNEITFDTWQPASSDEGEKDGQWNDFLVRKNQTMYMLDYTLDVDDDTNKVLGHVGSGSDYYTYIEPKGVDFI